MYHLLVANVKMSKHLSKTYLNEATRAQGEHFSHLSHSIKCECSTCNVNKRKIQIKSLSM